MDSCICGRDNVNRWIFSADLTKTYVWYSETGFYIFSESICMRMNFGNYQILYNWAVQKNEKIQQIQKRLNPAARRAQPACGVHVKRKELFAFVSFILYLLQHHRMRSCIYSKELKHIQLIKCFFIPTVFRRMEY